MDTRKTKHIQRAQRCSTLGNELFDLCQLVNEQHSEEYQSSITDEELDDGEFGFDTAALNAAINQFCSNFIKLWDNQAIATREYGKDARGILLKSDTTNTF